MGICILASACTPGTPGDGKTRAEEPSFVVSFDGLGLRAEPGPEGAVLRRLAAGARLSDLGQVSDFTTAIRLGGIAYNEPWLYVRTRSGEQGWVYAGGLEFGGQDGGAALPPRLLEKRLQTLFGPATTDRMAAYRLAFEGVETADSFAQVYREGVALRDECIRQLQTAGNRSPESPSPDLFWLQEALPGFIPQLVAEKTSYYLFADYRQWRKSARHTPETDDDAFVDLCLAAFPEDSIEFFFPAWTIQTSDYGGHSLLGRGIHHRLLRQMDKALAQSDRFRPEIEALKKKILTDVTSPDVTYWEPVDRIVRELEAILAQPPACLLRNDRIALEGRLDQFRDPASSGIVANQRAGE